MDSTCTKTTVQAHRVHILILILLLISFPVHGKDRPDQWAKEIVTPHLSNFYKINDQLYRGAQPSRAGFVVLQKMGIKTIINLRAIHSDRDEIEGLNLNYFHISFKAWHPEKEDVEKFFSIINDPQNYPIFIHCQHGADRTGTMVALYRIVHDKWNREEAINEMVNGGYGFHSLWKNLIEFVRNVNLTQPDK